MKCAKCEIPITNYARDGLCTDCFIDKLQAELDTLTAMLAKQKAVIPFTKIWDVEEEEIWNKL